MRNTIAKAVYEYCKNHKNGFLITGDAGFGVWDDFQKDLPTQYLNSGINEQASVGMAAGMALSGHKVFMYNIVPFLIYRCYEQVRNDICYHDLPIVLLGIGSGITYAPAGMTHYAVEDIGLASTIPNLEILSPSDPVQAKKCIEYSFNTIKPVYIRVSKSGEPVLFSEDIDIRRPNYLQKDGEFAILFHGSISDEALAAHSKLKNHNINIALISAPMLNGDDDSGYDQMFKKYKKVFVVEEHFEKGGLGSILTEKGFNPIKIGIKNKFIHEIGNAKYLRKLYGIDADSIVRCVKDNI